MCTCVCVPVCTRTAVILGRNSDWCSLDLPVCWAGILGKPGSEPLWGLVSLLQKELRVSTFQSSSESESRALVKVLSPSARLEGTEMGRHTAGGRVNPRTVQCHVGLERGRRAAADPSGETRADVPAGLWKCLLGALWQSQGSGEKRRISGKSISGKAPWQEVLRMECRAGRGQEGSGSPEWVGLLGTTAHGDPRSEACKRCRGEHTGVPGAAELPPGGRVGPGERRGAPFRAC